MKDDRVYLFHIQDALRQIRDYARDGESVFASDRKTQDAVIRNFEIIGEAVKNLSEDMKGAYPEIPWRDIAAMRDTDPRIFRCKTPACLAHDPR